VPHLYNTLHPWRLHILPSPYYRKCQIINRQLIIVGFFLVLQVDANFVSLPFSGFNFLITLLINCQNPKLLDSAYLGRKECGPTKKSIFFGDVIFCRSEQKFRVVPVRNDVLMQKMKIENFGHRHSIEGPWFFFT
jgi:hypothetical protein